MSSLDDDDEFFADIYDDDKKEVKEDVKKVEKEEVKVDNTTSNVSNSSGSGNISTGAGNGFTQPIPADLSSTVSALSHLVKSDSNEQPQQDSNRRFNTGNIYIPPKDEGKMFIGGLNWETTDESLKNYFSKYGQVLECNIMRDNVTGRSRGFGFLTFDSVEAVNKVVSQSEHYLDGKIIDPKRAIPREEQNKTAKIFVGGVGGDVNDRDFKDFFERYGVVIDAQLMLDKDTGRPRGFGFVTFDSDEAVEKILSENVLVLKNKAIEVKRAEPRGGKGGNLSDHGGRAETQGNAYGRVRPNNMGYGGTGGSSAYGEAAAAPANSYMGGMNPAVMSQYYSWYMNTMRQQMMNQGGNSPGEQNPQMASMMAMMQQQQQQQSGAGSPSTIPGVAGGAGSPGLPQPRPYEDAEGREEGDHAGQHDYRDREDDGGRGRYSSYRDRGDERGWGRSARSRSPPSNAPPSGPRGGRRGNGGGYNRRGGNRDRGDRDRGDRGYNSYQQR